MLLPEGLSPHEIRILQEFRRLNAEALTLEQIRAIKHPVPAGDEPAWALVDRGLLQWSDGSGAMGLTPKGREFLSYNPEP